MIKNLAVLGSTGSVGQSTLEVIRHNKDKFKIELLLANSNFQLMIEQYNEFNPKFVYLHDDEAKNSFLSQVGHLKPETTLLSGQEEIQEVLKSDNVDMVVAAMVGVAGLVPVYHAVKSGKPDLLANKES